MPARRKPAGMSPLPIIAGIPDLFIRESMKNSSHSIPMGVITNAIIKDTIPILRPFWEQNQMPSDFELYFIYGRNVRKVNITAGIIKMANTG